MAGSSWPALVAGSKARASDVEAKFDWIEGNIVPMTGGSTTDAAYDLGTSAARWRRGYFSTAVVVGIATASSSHFEAVASDDTTARLKATGADSRAFLVLSNDAQTWELDIEGADSDKLRIRNGSSGNIPFQVLASETVQLRTGTNIDEFSIDGTLAGNSDLAVPTEKAVKTYVDASVISLQRVKAHLTATQTVTAAAISRLLFTEIVDRFSEFSTSTFRPATNGTYDIRATIFCSGQTTTTQQPIIYLMMNSVTVTTVAMNLVGGIGLLGTLPVVEQLSMTTSDILEVYAIGRFDAFAVDSTTNRLLIEKIA